MSSRSVLKNAHDLAFGQYIRIVQGKQQRLEIDSAAIPEIVTFSFICVLFQGQFGVISIGEAAFSLSGSSLGQRWIMAMAPATRVLAVSGRIAASRSVNLRPLISGTLAEVLITEGDVIATGDTLARIDLSAQHAVVRQAVAGLDAALVAQDKAQLTYSRNRQMGTSAARSELENSELAMQSATLASFRP